MSERKVVVTGLGCVSSLGSTVDSFWDRLTSGQSGIRPIESFDTTEFKTKIAGEVADFDSEAFVAKKDQRRMDAFTVFSIASAKMAVDNSGLDMEKEDPFRGGAIIGSGIGGLGSLETQFGILLDRGPGRMSPFTIPQMICNIASGLVAIEHNLQGPNYAVVSACASAAHSIGDAMRVIQRGDADFMLAGGSEAAITPMGIGGFCAMKALSTNNDNPTGASRPFDAARDGFVMGEGGAILVLEELEHAKARGATIYCEAAGFGMTCDAYHMTAPAEGGPGAARAMTIAMNDAGVEPADVSYVNAHGTSTSLNDKSETQAIKTALGEEHARNTMISSTKSMTGHMLGAAAGIESIVTALAISRGVVPPTINQENPDPDCDLDYVPNVARESKVSVTLNNSLGFGGHNASLCFKAI